MQDKKNKIILTGGHLSPLLAVLEILQKKAECVVVGRRYPFEKDDTESLEFRILREEGVKFYNLTSGRFQRKISAQTIPSLMKSPGSYLRARRIIASEKPDAVLTFGGYIGLPVALAAYSKGVPVILHEQTLKAGLTNRLIGKIASVVCISNVSSAPFFPQEKTILTGNPIRQSVFRVEDKIPIPEGKPLLFVTGGSTGAHAINEFVEFLLPGLLEHFVIIHQTGDSQKYKDYDRLLSTAKKLPAELYGSYVVRKFILPSEIGWVYKNAEVVLSRAGANTVSELITLRKKALLVPLPGGQKEEQLTNAKFYADSELGVYIEQKDVELNLLLKTLILLAKKKTHVNKFTEENAALKIAAEVLKIVNGNKSKTK